LKDIHEVLRKSFESFLGLDKASGIMSAVDEAEMRGKAELFGYKIELPVEADPKAELFD
jgi:hypothetical protein